MTAPSYGTTPNQINPLHHVHGLNCDPKMSTERGQPQLRLLPYTNVLTRPTFTSIQVKSRSHR